MLYSFSFDVDETEPTRRALRWRGPSRINRLMEKTSPSSLTVFATLGVLASVQDLARLIIEDFENADQETVVLETLCLVSTVTSREIEAGRNIDVQIAESILSIPFLYRDYFFGGAMLLNRSSISATEEQALRDRLTRIQSFYLAHFPDQHSLTQRNLIEKMSLWMGRISPRGLAEKPTDRLNRLDLAELLNCHLKLIRAFLR